MTERDDQAAQDPGEEPVLFNVMLTPHRSLSPQGFIILMAAVGAVSFCAGLVFFLVGAWPVVGFLGLDVLLIYLAFRINYRHGRMYESLRLTADQLVVRRVDFRGRESNWRFQSTWLQVLIEDPPEHNSPLMLRSHGRSLAIGAFLTKEERVELAQALRGALVEARGTSG